MRALHGAYIAVLLSSAAPIAAPALTSFNVTSASDRPPLSSLLPGDEFTLSIRLSGGVGVYGLGASVWGYNESVVDFVSGEAVSSINHAVAIPAVGFFSGLANTLVPTPAPGAISSGPLSESSIGASGNRVLFFNGVGLTATNSNLVDPGLDGVSGSAQFRLTFRMVRLGTTAIHIGTGYNGDGEVLANGVTDTSSNTSIQITIIPEPGTALMVGIGLAAFAAKRRADDRVEESPGWT